MNLKHKMFNLSLYYIMINTYQLLSMEKLQTALKLTNLKVTTDRLELLKILQEKAKPTSIAELHTIASRRNPNLNLTTVYRNMETMEEVGLVQKFNFGENQFLYELRNEQDHHHHLVCSNCRKIIDLEKTFRESFFDQVERSHGFKVISHNFEIFGLCSECQTKI